MNNTFNETSQYIRKNLSNIILTERERKILEYRFGLTDNTTHTLEETGKIFGVTRERVRQIEAKVLDKIREYNFSQETERIEKLETES